MAKWNERKREILELAEKHGSLTSDLVSRELKIPIHSASVRLLAYTRQGLLRREPAPAEGDPFRRGRHPYAYTLTKRGVERLKYFRQLELSNLINRRK